LVKQIADQHPEWGPKELEKLLLRLFEVHDTALAIIPVVANGQLRR
jgi:hypothetical protein